MNDKDLHTPPSVSQLASDDISTPAHQARLRAALMARHPAIVAAAQPAEHIQQSLMHRLLGTFTQGAETIMKKNQLRIGASAFAISAMVIGLSAFGVMQLSPSASASELLDKASQRVSSMSDAEVAAVEKAGRQTLAERLAEARADRDLRLLSDDEFAGWIAAEPDLAGVRDPSLTYVTHTDSQNDRIVIGLAGDEEPVFVLNVDDNDLAPVVEPTNGIKPQE